MGSLDPIIPTRPGGAGIPHDAPSRCLAGLNRDAVQFPYSIAPRDRGGATVHQAGKMQTQAPRGIAAVGLTQAEEMKALPFLDQPAQCEGRFGQGELGFGLRHDCNTFGGIPLRPSSTHFAMPVLGGERKPAHLDPIEHPILISSRSCLDPIEILPPTRSVMIPIAHCDNSAQVIRPRTESARPPQGTSTNPPSTRARLCR